MRNREIVVRVVRDTPISKREIILRVTRVVWFGGAVCVALAAAGLGALILGVL
jgi:hypothetical protein